MELFPLFPRLVDVLDRHRLQGHRGMDSELPEGVTVQVRTDGTSEFVFVMNFSGCGQAIELDGRLYTDVESGLSADRRLELTVNGIRILKRPQQDLSDRCRSDIVIESLVRT